jgi:hypothetical protein
MFRENIPLASQLDAKSRQEGYYLTDDEDFVYLIHKKYRVGTYSARGVTIKDLNEACERHRKRLLDGTVEPVEASLGSL